MTASVTAASPRRSSSRPARTYSVSAEIRRPLAVFAEDLRARLLEPALDLGEVRGSDTPACRRARAATWALWRCWRMKSPSDPTSIPVVQPLLLAAASGWQTGLACSPPHPACRCRRSSRPAATRTRRPACPPSSGSVASSSSTGAVAPSRRSTPAVSTRWARSAPSPTFSANAVPSGQCAGADALGAVLDEQPRQVGHQPGDEAASAARRRTARCASRRRPVAPPNPRAPAPHRSTRSRARAATARAAVRRTRYALGGGALPAHHLDRRSGGALDRMLRIKVGGGRPAVT